MRKTFLALMALTLTVWAANLKMYMTDGSYQLVREYKVEGDRVKFYSIERSEWEEVPKELVDVARTDKEFKQRQAEIDKETKMFSEEEKVARDMEKEVMRIPQNPGVYWIEGEQAKALKAAESSVHTNKGRSVLKVLAPIPVVSGKATLEIDGAHAEHIFTNPDQEFYIQLSQTERFGMIKLMPKGTVRVVEDLTTVPVTKEVEEERNTVEVFQKQMTPDGLYKIWPKQSLLPGEYAVVEFTEGKMNMQIWDFAVKTAK